MGTQLRRRLRLRQQLRLRPLRRLRLRLFLILQPFLREESRLRPRLTQQLLRRPRLRLRVRPQTPATAAVAATAAMVPTSSATSAVAPTCCDRAGDCDRAYGPASVGVCDCDGGDDRDLDSHRDRDRLHGSDCGVTAAGSLPDAAHRKEGKVHRAEPSRSEPTHAMPPACVTAGAASSPVPSPWRAVCGSSRCLPAADPRSMRGCCCRRHPA